MRTTMPLNRKRVNGLPKAARLQARATVATASGFGVLWELRHDREAAEPATSFGRIRRQTPCFAPFPTALLVARLRSQSLPARSAHFCSSRPEGKVVFPRLLFQRTCVSHRSVRQKPRQLSRGELARLFSTACSPVLRGRPAAGVLPGGCCLRWPKGPRGQGLFCLPCRLSAAVRQKCTPGCQVAKFSDLGPCARPRGSPSSSSA